ncbi:hypothetical protein FGO68_gene6432 [Halteria grandinella]|uniref:Peptidase C39-like domain-containing protein n=1 Tax=Halteria grandinella TaxID=5974 RepID=A0A8J8NI13_HALGN|nr:hypothetical protein FGO68_gene6432 [Halteria grandinella]
MFAKATILISALLSATLAYPLFKQCDSAWGNNQLGTSSVTICKAGCLMSSMSMIINDCHKTIDGKASNPGTLNAWLRGHGGYVSGDLFVWGSVAPFGLSFVGFSSNDADIKNHFNQGHAVILNVNKGGHYVLMTGHSSSGYNAEVVKAGIYKRPAGCSSVLATVQSEAFLE